MWSAAVAVSPPRGRHDGEQGVLDGEVGHVVSMRRGADTPLTSR